MLMVQRRNLRIVTGDDKMADEVERHSEALSTMRDIVYNLEVKSRAFYCRWERGVSSL